MSTSRKAMDWLICFPIANLILGCLLFKKLKKINQFKKLLISSNMSYPRQNLIYLKQVCTFQPNQTNWKIRNIYNIKAHLSYHANSYFYNYKPSPLILRQHRVIRNLRKNKDIVITKPDQGNGVFTLYRKIYNNAIEEIISDTSKFKKLNEDPTLKCEASLKRILCKLK